MIVDIILGVVILLFLAIGMAWHISSRIIMQPREIKDDEWKNYNLHPERVTFQSADELKLDGALVPGSNGATVILLHGYGRSKEQMLPQAQFLNDAGYTVFMFDFRASGKSEGKFITFGSREVADLEGAIQYLRGRGDINMQRIGVLGFSMGGAVALLKSGEIEDIRAVVVNSTFARFKSVIWQNFQLYLKGIPFFPLGYLTLLVMKFRTGIYYAGINPISRLKALEARPLMVIHGAHDKRIPVEDAMEFHRTAPWLKEFWLVKNADHSNTYTMTKDEYEHKVLGFFRKFLLH
ncbi:MAG: alpha/beta fold hydrolase [Candidatus Kerfeldbacteria bacterium]|nr:alpha/beta fold hydrolase [Candidatus Kerfeldbacteria bacterium]